MSDVVILMGTRNGAPFLGPQLASIAGQVGVNLQLQVSDDASTDGTLDILKNFQAKHGPARMGIKQGPNQGVAANYLSLLNITAKDSIQAAALADQDDIWHPDHLTRAVSALAQIPPNTPAIYAAATRLIDAEGRVVEAKPARPKCPSFANALVQNILPGNTMVLNRAALDLAARLRPDPLPPFHDWWLYALVTGIGGQVILDPKPALDYRQHPGALLGAHAGPKARKHRRRLVLDGTWRRWLAQHHAALGSIDEALTPEAQKALTRLSQTKSSGLGRFAAYLATGSHRQSRLGTWALRAAALRGLA